jgi:hypothetical protein
VVDTDILNWNIQVGAARNFDDMNNNIKNSFDLSMIKGEFEDEMVFYLYVQLNDHMS